MPGWPGNTNGHPISRRKSRQQRTSTKICNSINIVVYRKKPQKISPMSGWLQGINYGLNIADKGSRIYKRHWGTNPPKGYMSGRRRRPNTYQLSIMNAKKIKNLQKAREWKFKDTVLSAEAAVQAGTFTCLTEIGPGDGESQRTGEQVAIGSIALKGYLYQDTGSSTYELVRIIVFQDLYGQTTPTLNSAATPGLATDVITWGAAGTAVFLPPHQDNKGRFRILVDQMVSLESCQRSNDATNPINGQFKAIPFKYYKKFKKLRQCSYTGTSGTDYGRGNIWFVICGNNSSNVTRFNGQNRIYFLG